MSRVDDRSGVKEARTVRLPNHVEEGGASDVDGAYTHAVEIVEVALDATNVAAEAEVDLALVVFEDSAKKVVVSWVTICELVEKQGVEGELTPVLGRRSVGRVWSGGGIVEDVCIWVWVHVDIPLDEVGLVVMCISGGEGECKHSEDEGRKGGRHGNGGGRRGGRRSTRWD